MLYFDLFLTTVLYLAGSIIFSVFAKELSIPRRLLKVSVLLGLTAVLSTVVGHPWSAVLIIGTFALGTIFHVWLMVSHGINPITAEPRDKYYALRGWS